MSGRLLVSIDADTFFCGLNVDGPVCVPQAEDGWWFRPWNRDDAYEFVKFTIDGAMVVHHFTGYPNDKYCCMSTSYVEHRDECCHKDSPVAAKGKSEGMNASA